MYVRARIDILCRIPESGKCKYCKADGISRKYR